MTFSYTINGRQLIGNAKLVYGTFSNDGDSTGGEIETALRTIENFSITHIDSTIVSDAPVINGTIETTTSKAFIRTTDPQGTITIVTVANTSGFWMAIGT
jgi:hypothetical protein